MPYVGITDSTWETVWLPGKSDINTTGQFQNAIKNLASEGRRLKNVNQFPIALPIKGGFDVARNNPTLSRKLQLCRAWLICGFCRLDRHAWNVCPARLALNASQDDKAPNGKRSGDGMPGHDRAKK
jgi:hypothetical protein